MKKIFLGLILLLSYVTYGQIVNLEWVKQMPASGNSGNSAGNSVAVDKSGNIYTSGYFAGTVDFDPGVGVVNLTSNTTWSSFIQKCDRSGNFLWVTSLEGTYFRGHDIALDNENNVYTTGAFKGMVDFDPGTGIYNLTSIAFDDAYIQKLDSNGNFIWAKQMGGLSGDEGISIEIDTLGNIYTTGQFTSTSVDFDPGIGISYIYAPGGHKTVFVQKLDSNGNFVWAKQIGTLSSFMYGDGESTSIDTDNKGNVYITGYFTGTFDFDPDTVLSYTLNSNILNWDIYILKLDSNGNFMWVKSMGSNGGDGGLDLAIDNSNNVYTTGYFTGTVDFDPGVIGVYNLTSIPISDGDGYIQKLDSNGNFIWVKQIIGPGYNTTSISIDRLENIYNAGSFNGSVDFDSTIIVDNLTSSYWGSNGYIQKLDSNGNFIWSIKQSEGSGNGGISSIAIDSLNNIYTTGGFTGVMDFDPNVTTANLAAASGVSSDIYTQKLVHCSSPITIAQHTVCGSYTWIDGVTYTSSTNLPKYTLTNTSGCDSVINLNLIINNSLVTIDEQFACEHYTWVNGITYTESTNLPTDTLTNILGCDSVINLNLTIYNSEIYIDTIVACNSYTWLNGITYTANNNAATDTLTNAFGCDSIVKLDLTIDTIDIGVDKNDRFVFANNSSATYQWLDCKDFSKILGEIYQYFEPKNNNYYAVEILKNNCLDTSRCILIPSIPKITIPNIFTPNNDGMNDSFLPEDIRLVSLTIYNRWGKKVLETKDAGIDFSSLVDGTYYYLIQHENNQLEQKQLKGWVEIAR